MKISNSESIRAGQVSPVGDAPPVTPAAKTAQPGTGATPAARLELSPQAQALAAAKTEATQYLPAVNAVPDREDRVTDLKTRIAAGAYQVSAQDIAGQILNRAQADKIR